MKDNHLGRTWEEFEKEIFTPKEIAESKRRVKRISEIIDSRNDKQNDSDNRKK